MSDDAKNLTGMAATSGVAPSPMDGVQYRRWLPGGAEEQWAGVLVADEEANDALWAALAWSLR